MLEERSPMECREAIEKLLQDKVDQSIIATVTEANGMGVISDIPLEARWYSLHMFRPHDLNKAIIWEHYKAPTLDEITHKLSEAKVFSKLVVKDGFWSIHLNTPSFLTTFNTHKGCYQFLCMPFGLKMSQDVFQMQMVQTTDRLPGIIAIHNDICVYGKDTTEHDKKFTQSHANCSRPWSSFQQQQVFNLPALNFILWSHFHSARHETRSCKGTSFARPPPQNPKQCQSFLGLINYLQPFLPGLASKTTFLT